MRRGMTAKILACPEAGSAKDRSAHGTHSKPFGELARLLLAKSLRQSRRSPTFDFEE